MFLQLKRKSYDLLPLFSSQNMSDLRQQNAALLSDLDQLMSTSICEQFMSFISG